MVFLNTDFAHEGFGFDRGQTGYPNYHSVLPESGFLTPTTSQVRRQTNTEITNANFAVISGVQIIL